MTGSMRATFSDPLLARALNAVYGGLRVPDAPRNDLLLLGSISAADRACRNADRSGCRLTALEYGSPPTPAAKRSRLGALANDLGGFPNGRRVSDDVTDIALRVVAGVLAGFSGAPYNSLGDGVNANDVPYQETFPYVAFANSGRPPDTPAATATGEKK